MADNLLYVIFGDIYPNKYDIKFNRTGFFAGQPGILFISY